MWEKVVAQISNRDFRKNNMEMGLVGLLYKPLELPVLVNFDAEHELWNKGHFNWRHVVRFLCFYAMLFSLRIALTAKNPYCFFEYISHWAIVL